MTRAPPPAFPRNPRGRLGFPGPTQGEGCMRSPIRDAMAAAGSLGTGEGRAVRQGALQLARGLRTSLVKGLFLGCLSCMPPIHEVTQGPRLLPWHSCSMGRKRRDGENTRATSPPWPRRDLHHFHSYPTATWSIPLQRMLGNSEALTDTD